MEILIISLLSLFLGYFAGVQHERKKYVFPDKSNADFAVKKEKISIWKKIKKKYFLIFFRTFHVRKKRTRFKNLVFIFDYLFYF